MSKCKLCQEDKPQDEFYRTGTGGRERVCKQCTSLINRTLRAYTKWAPRDRAEWPPLFIADVEQIAAYVEAGGQPPQKTKVTALLRHLSFTPPDDVKAEVSVEAFLYLMSRVAALEAALDARPSDAAPKLHTQWADAMAKVVLPGMSDEDLLAWKGAMSKLKAAISYGQVVSPTIIRDIVVPLEVDLIPWPDSCTAIYDTYIAPALTAASQDPSYASLVQELVDLTSRNYYELKWPLIPYDARDED